MIVNVKQIILSMAEESAHVVNGIVAVNVDGDEWRIQNATTVKTRFLKKMLLQLLVGHKDILRMQYAFLSFELLNYVSEQKEGLKNKIINGCN